MAASRGDKEAPLAQGAPTATVLLVLAAAAATGAPATTTPRSPAPPPAAAPAAPTPATAPQGVAGRAADAAKRIFHLDSYHAGYAVSDETDVGLRSVLADKPVRLQTFYLDTKRHGSE